jgi:hypothetical protein
LTVVTALQDIDGQVTDSQAAAVPHYCWRMLPFCPLNFALPNNMPSLRSEPLSNHQTSVKLYIRHLCMKITFCKCSERTRKTIFITPCDNLEKIRAAVGRRSSASYMSSDGTGSWPVSHSVYSCLSHRFLVSASALKQLAYAGAVRLSDRNATSVKASICVLWGHWRGDKS